VTSTDFDHIVIGRGLMGAAATRHLAASGGRVAVIGPGEPVDRLTHPGVFGSHYDEGRITRILDPDPIWALVAQRSLARYREIEALSGVRFYHEVGHLMVSPSPRAEGEDEGHSAQVLRVARELDVACDMLNDDALNERFGYLSFEPGMVGFHQPHTAGHVSPRGQVRAQVLAAERHGAMVIDQIVRRVRAGTDHVVATLANGAVLRAGRALVATGGFSNVEDLLPRPLDITVRARTIVLAELVDADVDRLSRMPSVIYRPHDATRGCYLLPPIRYPDGKWYLKIGGRSDDQALSSLADLQGWFRGTGDPETAQHLIDRLHTIVPKLRPAAIHTDSCVTTHTPTGHVYADRLDGGPLGVLVGGNGTAAKSADELGRLGALMMRHDEWAYDIPPDRFTARFAPAS
jgi:sarcosine oxidase